MAGRNLYELTPREREVFDLLRLGLTNAEIGERLGITEAGAKYHVAQILSKLGVSSREEAAALALEARPWWARALATGVAARAAAAGVVVAALAGLGILVWGVLETGSGSTPADLEGLTEEQLYARVGEALRPPDRILHTRLTTSSGPMETGGTILWYTIDFWIDGANDTFRSEFQLGPDMEWDVAAETVSITVGHYTYVQDEPERVYRKEIDETYCPGSGDAIVGTILMCGFAAFSAEIDTNTQYDGRHAVAVRHRISDDSGEGITNVYMDAVTFLPMARTITSSPDGHEVRIIVDYEHELVDPASLPSGFLDPRSLGYGVGNEDEALDEIAREVSVYWLGSDVEIGEQAFCRDLMRHCSLVLAQVGRGGPGIASLGYETPSGVSAVGLHLWTPDAFEEFRLTDLGRLLYDAPCVSQRELKLESGGRAIMFAAHRPIFGTGA